MEKSLHSKNSPTPAVSHAVEIRDLTEELHDARCAAAPHPQGSTTTGAEQHGRTGLLFSPGCCAHRASGPLPSRTTRSERAAGQSRGGARPHSTRPRAKPRQPPPRRAPRSRTHLPPTQLPQADLQRLQRGLGLRAVHGDARPPACPGPPLLRPVPPPAPRRPPGWAATVAPFRRRRLFPRLPGGLAVPRSFGGECRGPRRFLRLPGRGAARRRSPGRLHPAPPRPRPAPRALPWRRRGPSGGSRAASALPEMTSRGRRGHLRSGRGPPRPFRQPFREGVGRGRAAILEWAVREGSPGSAASVGRCLCHTDRASGIEAHPLPSAAERNARGRGRPVRTLRHSGAVRPRAAAVLGRAGSRRRCGRHFTAGPRVDVVDPRQR